MTEADRKRLFDAIREVKGTALTQRDVGLINEALGYPVEPVNGMPDDQLIEDLKRDEGLRLTAYKDTVGVWTVGYGHAHVAPGTVWTREEAERMLRLDAAKHGMELEKRAPWIASLDPVRRRVLWNMAFNLGVNGLLGFKNTLAMIQRGEYAKAADAMLKSKWSRQVGQRAQRLANQMRDG